MRPHSGVRPRGVVYTCLFGFSEKFSDFRYKREDVDFVCFTDDPDLRSDFWEIRLVSPGLLDPTRAAKRIKHLPHRYLPDYEWCLYIDNTVLLKIDPGEIYERFLRNARSPLVCFHHESRDCVYDEGEVVRAFSYDKPWRVGPQMDYYKSLGYPPENGLYWTGLLLRRHHDPGLVRVMEQWHEQVLLHSARDQLSLPVVLHYNNLIPEVIEANLMGAVMKWPAVRGERLPRDFDDARYLQLNPDVSINPRKHYLLYGHAEGRPYKLEDEERSVNFQITPEIATVRALMSSRSWRLAWHITAPLRVAAKFVEKLATTIHLLPQALRRAVGTNSFGPGHRIVTKTKLAPKVDRAIDCGLDISGAEPRRTNSAPVTTDRETPT